MKRAAAPPDNLWGANNRVYAARLRFAPSQ